MSPPSIWMAYAGVACDAMCEVKSMRKVPRQRIVMRGSLKGFFGSPPFICSLDCCAIARAPGRPRVFLLHLCTEANRRASANRLDDLVNFAPGRTMLYTKYGCIE